MSRRALRTIHVYLGLAVGLWLVLVGLTGSVLVYYREIDAALNSQLFTASDGPPLAADRLVAAAESAGYGPVGSLDYPHREGRPVVAIVESGERVIGVYVDAATARVNGARDLDRLGLDRGAIIYSVYLLHADLLLGELGLTIVGVGAIMLTIMSITGIYLWWPRIWKARKFWFQPSSKGIRFAFDLHKVGGLYVTPVFLVLAVSGFYFAFPNAFSLTIHALLPSSPRGEVAAPSGQSEGVGWANAVTAAQTLYPDAVLSQVRRDGEGFLVTVRQPGEFRTSFGGTGVAVDGDGLVVVRRDALRASVADRVVEAQFPLHNGELGGATGRALIALAGIVPLLLAVTGFLVWLRTRPRKRGQTSDRRRVGPRPVQQ